MPASSKLLQVNGSTKLGGQHPARGKFGFFLASK